MTGSVSPEIGCDSVSVGAGGMGPSWNRCRSLPQTPLNAGAIFTVPGRTWGSSTSSMRMSSLP